MPLTLLRAENVEVLRALSDHDKDFWKGAKQEVNFSN